MHRHRRRPTALRFGPLLAKPGITTFGVASQHGCRWIKAPSPTSTGEGILRYRAYPIDQLREKSTFIEVCYLLIYGELPDTDQLAQFTGRIQRHTMLHTRISS